MKIALKDKLAAFADTWSPRTVAQVDDHAVRLAHLEGDFVWHAHADADELFLVLDGRFRMDWRDGAEWVETGEMLVVPRGVEHKPFAPERCSVLLFEREDTVNTGDAADPRTVTQAERI
ncbi:cupin domain-containing protein [Yunchengibacter salinarum]|uniref:cupin domain-containing protein n=1 Tax=Yunchengibacter salinarum TaxID=3133399 RepID=UPI0035B5EC13